MARPWALYQVAGLYQRAHWLAALLKLRCKVTQARQRLVSARIGSTLADKAYCLHASIFPGLCEAVNVTRCPVGAILQNQQTFVVLVTYTCSTPVNTPSKQRDPAMASRSVQESNSGTTRF